MVIVQINATGSAGSTGKICVALSELLTERGIENRIFYNNGSSGYPLSIRYASPREIKTAALASRLLGDWGFEGKAATKKLIRQLDELQPDILHLHNLHSHACHLEMLFEWIAKRQIKVIWTFHDCWAFTGYCMHYAMSGCEKWRSGCGGCPQKKEYSWLLDRSRTLYDRKKMLFAQQDLTIVTPSRWLADQVPRSFLKDHPVRVIRNGIDLSVFRPTASDFKTRCHLQNKHIVLGVSFSWGRKKGLDVFCDLAQTLGEEYRIVLVGVNESVKSSLPDHIITLERTKDQRELAAIYSAADVFVNPTREDTYPTVNMEALACGTPVVTFDTGGCAETINESCGVAVPKDDVESLREQIIRACEEKAFTKEACLRRAADFDQHQRFHEYLSLYLQEP